MVPEDLQSSVKSSDKGFKELKWEVFVEKAGVWDEPDLIKNGLVDHINTTKDTTDYLWYTTRLVFDLEILALYNLNGIYIQSGNTMSFDLA